ncbi:MAG: hypothetical protein JO165_02865 [Candidatus Eremiobacteraeota bacterium]|nr:hypothetical protein [Candidatus Eremiobacteraeota bacterium]
MLAAATAPTLPSAQAVIQAAGSRTARIRQYTFDVDAHIALLTFPWIRFRLTGHGQYTRGGAYFVHFDRVPWFGHGFETMPMGALDPQTWPRQYSMSVAQSDGDRTVLRMHDLKKSPLTEAIATFDQQLSVRELLWTYNYGGHVKLDITPQTVSGFAFPGNEDAEIVMPHYRAMAHAVFTNYRVVTDGP